MEVTDGDTMEVRFPNGDEEPIRLLGVDTPEVSGGVSPGEFEGIPSSEAGRDHLSEWADRASGFASDELSAGEEVRIEVDPSADRRGSFDRLLVYLYHDGGELFNQQLLDQGYARFYDSEFSMQGEFADIEEQAQSNDVGLWDFESASTSTPTPSDGVELPPMQDGGDYDCGQFDNREQVEAVFEPGSGDPYRLDSDGDGEACETVG